MFWLCYYNGLDKPTIECAFCSPRLLVEYADEFIPFDRRLYYTVFDAYKYSAKSLESFIKKEY